MGGNGKGSSWGAKGKGTGGKNKNGNWPSQDGGNWAGDWSMGKGWGDAKGWGKNQDNGWAADGGKGNDQEVPAAKDYARRRLSKDLLSKQYLKVRVFLELIRSNFRAPKQNI